MNTIYIHTYFVKQKHTLITKSYLPLNHLKLLATYLYLNQISKPDPP